MAYEFVPRGTCDGLDHHRHLWNCPEGMNAPASTGALRKLDEVFNNFAADRPPFGEQDWRQATAFPPATT